MCPLHLHTHATILCMWSACIHKQHGGLSIGLAHGRQGTLSRSGPDEATLAAITAAVSPAGSTAGGAAAAKRALEVHLALVD